MTVFRAPAALTSPAWATTWTVSPDRAGNRSASRLCARAESEPGAEESLANAPPKAAESPKAMASAMAQAISTVPLRR